MYNQQTVIQNTNIAAISGSGIINPTSSALNTVRGGPGGMETHSASQSVIKKRIQDKVRR